MNEQNVENFRHTTTATDWLDRINGLQDSAEMLAVAETLAKGAHVAEDYPRHLIIEHALEMHLMKEGLAKFLIGIRDLNERNKISLELRVTVTDLILRRNNLEEIQFLNLFLSMNKGFVPEFRLKEVSNLADELEQIQKTRQQTLRFASGVIDVN